MNVIKNKIIKINIEEELKRSYLDYAMSVIIGRALPDVRDGLKPVHRRILFAMKKMGNDWNKSYKKSARIVGNVIGKYHPHGDSAVYDAIVRMAQNFSLRYKLIDGQGNFGSVDGDSAAAMRYTEVRLSKISHEILKDLEKDTVNYVSNYDDTEYIPEVMPTKIPNLLLNGSSGIAVGMATNIPPHNIGEIINACLAYLDNKNICVKDLMKHLPGPDFPTSGIIYGIKGIEDAYSTGRGKIYIRANSKIISDNKTKRESIIIKEIPYQVNKVRLIEKIADLVKEKKIDGISSLRDESDRDGMRIVVEIKRDHIGEIVLNNLYSMTQLQISFGINMVALCYGQPKTLSLKKILSYFLYHRRVIITRKTNFELKKIYYRLNMLESFFIALFNIDIVISLIKNSNSIEEAQLKLVSNEWDINNIYSVLNNKKLIHFFSKKQKINSNSNKKNKYFMSKKQAKAILDLRLNKLMKLENKKLILEYKDLVNKSYKLNKILKYPDELTNSIKKELLILKQEYNDKRRTKIIKKPVNINIEDLINQKDVIVTLSHQGYVKYQPLKDYEAQHRGGKGKSAASIKEKDFIERFLVANTHDSILLFSSKGRVYWMKIFQLPENSRGSIGKPIINLLPLESKEYITAILPFRKYEKKLYVFMATASGIVKKTALHEFSRPRSSGIIAVNLNSGDKLIGADLTDGSQEAMLFSEYGKVVRFPENQVRNMGRAASGVKGISLIPGDRVVSLIIPKNNSPILTVTQYGYGKRTVQSEYPTKSRAIQGVISIKVSKRNGKVVGAVQVNDYDQIMIITDSGTLVRIRVSEVSIVGRNTHGVRLIRISNNNNVVGLQRVVEKIENL
ncbi:gyrA [Wigglesworthia glossinidia endosymbiont of Glossina brevipalpis]|uniref:DNA gyrase subunit A n=1 Tax=Wigglesworthia glossinidia brevipalpis TaxID=36870 RepID=Q8D2A9_WIGBR|nr:gyrA [Wigglesworthia glossinidia endosymbiont of Glossina brevipalpis]